MKNTIRYISGIAFCIAANCYAQNFGLSSEWSEFNRFVQDTKSDFENFSNKSMVEFAEFVKNPWKEFDAVGPIPKPDFKPITPIAFDNNKVIPQIDDTPVEIDRITDPIIEEKQPQPIAPIEESPIIEPTYLYFTFFGTPEKARIGSQPMPMLSGVNEASVAAMLENLATDDNNNLIMDCLTIRDNRNLSDWAYLQMLDTIANTMYHTRHNEAQVLLSYLFVQSGYKMRMASDGTKLYMLFACEHTIYEKPSFNVDGEKYYGLMDLPKKLFICQAAYPKEKSLSLLIQTKQRLNVKASATRKITSEKYPEISFEVTVNKNLLDFYATYPTSAVNGNMMTRWAMVANAPFDDAITSKLYPTLKTLLKNKTELEAAEILLNTVQTGFTYGYDDEIWGSDRIFFAEETLFYPYCDCEDRAILFTKLVRDILGLKCLLVYYPGHLAAAIEFSDKNINGDYLLVDGHKYIIADPTYFNAPIGESMPGIDISAATAIKIN